MGRPKGASRPPETDGRVCEHCQLFRVPVDLIRSSVPSLYRPVCRLCKTAIADAVAEKTCACCRIVQPRSAFGYHLQRVDGLRAECDACNKAQQARYRTAHPEKIQCWQQEHQNRQDAETPTRASRGRLRKSW